MSNRPENHNNPPVQDMISEYIRKELLSDREDMVLKNDTPLLDPHMIDSLSLLKLVLFLEKAFEITVGQDELLPKNFSTIDSISGYVRMKLEKK